MAEKLTIAIDYDFTFTALSTLFTKFIWDCLSCGHEVICVTGRDKPPDRLREAPLPAPVKVICAGDMPKREAAEKAGYKVNIWIDDMPGTIEPPLKLSFD